MKSTIRISNEKQTNTFEKIIVLPERKPGVKAGAKKSIVAEKIGAIKKKSKNFVLGQ